MSSWTIHCTRATSQRTCDASMSKIPANGTTPTNNLKAISITRYQTAENVVHLIRIIYTNQVRTGTFSLTECRFLNENSWTPNAVPSRRQYHSNGSRIRSQKTCEAESIRVWLWNFKNNTKWTKCWTKDETRHWKPLLAGSSNAGDRLCRFVSYKKMQACETQK